MKNILYKISQNCFLTAGLVRKIEERVTILYPSTQYSVKNRTAEYLFRIYVAGLLVITGLFICSEFSVYYASMAALVAYAVVHTRIYGELEKLEVRLLRQFEQFITDVKFRFQFDGMLEEAIQDAINEAEYEMSIQGELLLECLRADYQMEREEYKEVAPNHYFLTFYSICLMTLKYGDKKIDGDSMFVKNLGCLKEDISMEYLKRKKIDNAFMGLSGLTIVPIFAIKPIEQWALANMPELTKAYHGFVGVLSTIFLMLFSVIIYKLIEILRKTDYKETYKNHFIEYIAKKEWINNIILFYVFHRQKVCIKMDRLLREVVYPYRLTEFLLLRWICAFLCMMFGIFLLVSISAPVFVIMFGAGCGLLMGYYGPYLKIMITRQMLIMEREEEIVRFQTIIRMVMYIDRMTVAEILHLLESFAVSFRGQIFELENNFSYKGMDTFRQAKGIVRFFPYEKLLDSFLACDIMPISQAFADIESDRRYYVDKQKQDNEELIEKKSLIAKTISFLPLCMVIIIKLIIPFVVEGISGLSNNMMM